MELGQRANTVGCQELILGEHVVHDAAQTLLVDQRKQQAIILSANLHAGDVALRYVLAVLDDRDQGAADRGGALGGGPPPRRTLPTLPKTLA